MNRSTDPDRWRFWDNYKDYGDYLYKRAIGELDEMESSKAVCEVLTRFYEPGMSVLDVGCGAGHYLTSLKKRLDPEINFTGVDPTEYYIQLARKAYPTEGNFLVDDILNLHFEDESFDIVMCNNALQHIPPPPTIALRELLRVSTEYVVLRALVGQNCYVIKKLLSSGDADTGQDESEQFTESGEPMAFEYLNMYTERYYRSTIHRIDPHATIHIQADRSWRDFDESGLQKSEYTKTASGMQIYGNLILDWNFIVIRKSD